MDHNGNGWASPFLPPPVTAFAICFRQSRPVPSLIRFYNNAREPPPVRPSAHFSGQREVARQAVAHEEGRTVFRVAACRRSASEGRSGAHLFPMQTSSSYRARCCDVEERGAKTTFRRYFRSERTKKGVAVVRAWLKPLYLKCERQRTGRRRGRGT